MYRIIPGKVLPTQFKITVNPEQSKALQEYLFSKGVVWGSGEKIVQYVGNMYLFVYPDHILTAFLNSPSYFNGHDNKEIKFDDYFERTTDSIPLSTKLKDLLENMTQEEFDKAWEEIKNLRLIGPTIEEYLKSK